jgi:hypothetical protein
MGRGGTGRDGGGDGSRNNAQGGASSQATAATINSGGGGGGGYGPSAWGGSFPATSGGSGVVILRYPSYRRDLSSIGPGLTYNKFQSGDYTVYEFTAGSDTITF